MAVNGSYSSQQLENPHELSDVYGVCDNTTNNTQNIDSRPLLPTPAPFSVLNAPELIEMAHSREPVVCGHLASSASTLKDAYPRSRASSKIL